MKRTSFEVTLKQPLIISRNAASSGSHQSLDYLPGSVFLGLAASRLYAGLDMEAAWALFHSGSVRFGDGLPLHGNECAYPAPLSLHAAKGAVADNNGVFDAAVLFDPALAPPTADIQPVQIRQGYVTESGRKVQPRMQQTLKTAIDRRTGSAADGQLFGYEALSEQQRFRFTLSADDGISEGLWQQLIDALKGDAALGRSRTAQFGAVHINQSHKNMESNAPVNAGNQLCLWLQSDLALSRAGQPVLQPDPDLLGLPEGSLWLAEKSHLRSRRYSVFNAYRRSFDPERQVITRGSILRFALPRALTAEELSALNQGIGLYTECGLGQVLINPIMLQHTSPQFTTALPEADPAKQTASRPDTPLIRVLMHRAGHTGDAQLNQETANILFTELCTKIDQARRFAGLKAGQTLALVPGRSQWGRLKQLASDYRHDANALWKALAESDDCVFRDRVEAPWGLRYGPGNEEKLFVWMKQALAPHKNKDSFPLLIGQLAVFGLQAKWQDCCDGKLRHSQEITP